jgi:hypothetical protein
MGQGRTGKDRTEQYSDSTVDARDMLHPTGVIGRDPAAKTRAAPTGLSGRYWTEGRRVRPLYRTETSILDTGIEPQYSIQE